MKEAGSVFESLILWFGLESVRITCVHYTIYTSMYNIDKLYY